MSDYRQVPSAQLRLLNDLAEATYRQLLSAGLPATIVTLDHDTAAGVNIEVDSGDDSTGGVYARWAASEALRASAIEALLHGRSGDPALHHNGAVSSAMRDAMLLIFSSAGFTVDLADTDYAPYGIRVIAKPDE